MAKTAVITTDGLPDEVYDYTYTARGPDDKLIRGKAKAQCEADIAKELSRRGLTPLKIKGGPGAGLQTEIAMRKTAKHRSLVITTRMLAAMFDAGLSPLESLDVAIDGADDDLVLKNALIETRLKVQQGIPMSAAMASQPAFPPTVINFLKAGETGGDIKGAFLRIADQYDAEDRLRSKVKKAMMYPMVVTIISAIIFAFMMLYLVPQFAESFKDIGGEGAELPMLTRGVVAASGILKFAMPISVVVVVPMVLWYKAHKNDEKVREFMDPFKLKLPIFGNLFHKIALARFTRNLSGLLGAGVERLEALEITAETVGNISMERAIIAARDAQRQGQALVDPLKAEPLFPSMVIQMVEVGERSGRTGEMLGKASDIFDRDVDTITDNLSALIEPLFLVILGAMISVIVIAIYLPYLSIGQMI